jgi:hypothetical protein
VSLVEKIEFLINSDVVGFSFFIDIFLGWDLNGTDSTVMHGGMN